MDSTPKNTANGIMRQRVEPGQEHERHDLEAVGRVPVGAHVAEDAQDVHRGGEADERAAEHEGDDDEPGHVDAQVDRGTRVGAQHVQAGAERGPGEQPVDGQHDTSSATITPMWMRVPGRFRSIARRVDDAGLGHRRGPSKGPLTSRLASLTPMNDIISVVTISLRP